MAKCNACGAENPAEEDRAVTYQDVFDRVKDYLEDHGGYSPSVNGETGTVSMNISENEVLRWDSVKDFLLTPSRRRSASSCEGIFEVADAWACSYWKLARWPAIFIDSCSKLANVDISDATPEGLMKALDDVDLEADDEDGSEAEENSSSAQAQDVEKNVLAEIERMKAEEEEEEEEGEEEDRAVTYQDVFDRVKDYLEDHGGYSPSVNGETGTVSMNISDNDVMHWDSVKDFLLAPWEGHHAWPGQSGCAGIFEIADAWACSYWDLDRWPAIFIDSCSKLASVDTSDATPEGLMKALDDVDLEAVDKQKKWWF